MSGIIRWYSLRDKSQFSKANPRPLDNLTIREGPVVERGRYLDITLKQQHRSYLHLLSRCYGRFQRKYIKENKHNLYLHFALQISKDTCPWTKPITRTVSLLSFLGTDNISGDIFTPNEDYFFVERKLLHAKPMESVFCTIPVHYSNYLLFTSSIIMYFARSFFSFSSFSDYLEPVILFFGGH